LLDKYINEVSLSGIPKYTIQEVIMKSMEDVSEEILEQTVSSHVPQMPTI